jgi:diketogulonate reductase-like aldo/keto reductase
LGPEADAAGSMTLPVGVKDASRSVAGVAVSADTVRTTQLPSGEAVPVLGQGTWYLGEGRQSRAEEIAALRLGLDLGMGLIDTAEMYGNGAAEELVGEAIAGRRDEVFLVSKVLPGNATCSGTVAACERSLRRLRTDQLDLYLLHWRGAIPFAETLQGFDALIRARKIRYWGVSNFDLADMQELWSLPDGANAVTDQVLYNLARRAIEWDLLPWCRARRLPIMAYSPIEQGRLLAHPVVRSVAGWHGATAAQVALAWVLRHRDVIAIPRAGDPRHVRENRAALDLRLTAPDLAALDRAFPPPTGPQPLEML